MRQKKLKGDLRFGIDDKFDYLRIIDIFFHIPPNKFK